MEAPKSTALRRTEKLPPEGGTSFENFTSGGPGEIQFFSEACLLLSNEEINRYGLFSSCGISGSIKSVQFKPGRQNRRIKKTFFRFLSILYYSADKFLFIHEFKNKIYKSTN